ncbi:vanadium-dependent haloperoxidase [Phytomonospora endophytica]|uniref:Phosphatidic acid phosphatase type 2/haloperoxidase domain-containing protein n=1 Tax=Phytomonospora endophytica TaxID=714109 RepID=A0A841FYG6_9ACTN|nr:vanadium-dependent haloperoxidase [Phytomonospora endophytica]MBB6037010.1 hypothetical protein [Phytomonospora endophytica]GIG69446.1 haloperoxidase [Phytomonospora endophytica]
MHKTSRRRLIVAAALTPAALALPTPAHADTIDPVAEWYDLTADAVTTSGPSAQVSGSRIWALAWLSAARALHGDSHPDRQSAALVSAVHAVLRDQIPSRATDLDAALEASLARVPDGSPKRRGTAAGRAEARSLLTGRAGDGLDPASVNAPYTPDPPTPGRWQPTPPAFGPGQQSGTRHARPFLLGRADRFRPPPPPALDSARDARDLAEVRAFGALDSTVRTQAQTDTAQFWYGSSLVLYNGILRAALLQSRRSAYRRARLVALFHVALVDTQIATSDAKYHHRSWRPVTAIRALHDPQWTPYHVTPSHPDYVSGHNTYSGAAEAVLAELAGPARPYTIGSPSAPGVTRTYTDWSTPSRENVDARVWSGIHTRTADEAGIILGRKVARHALSRAERLFD